MSDPNNLNAEVARLLEIISNNPGISSGPIAPPLPPAPPHPPPSTQPLHTATLSTWPQAHQPHNTSPPLTDASDYSAQFPQHPSQSKTDPSTITQWPAALRYITTVVARDEPVMTKLRKVGNQLWKWIKPGVAKWHPSKADCLRPEPLSDK